MNNEQLQKLEHEFDRKLTEGEAEEIKHAPVTRTEIENPDALPIENITTSAALGLMPQEHRY